MKFYVSTPILRADDRNRSIPALSVEARAALEFENTLAVYEEPVLARSFHCAAAKRDVSPRADRGPVP